MRYPRDWTGHVFGKLTAVKYVGEPSRGYYAWECVCECGNRHTVQTSHLIAGSITSCGCNVRTRRGASLHPLFKTWSNMVRRCTDPSDPAYPNYGGRGVKVSDDWMDPAKFISDMSPRPRGLTLERVDNDGPYSKENCKWADRIEQANNKRNVKVLILEGVARTLPEWSRHVGMPVETLRSRIAAGLDIRLALSLPRHNRSQRYTYVR